MQFHVDLTGFSNFSPPIRFKFHQTSMLMAWGRKTEDEKHWFI